MSNQKRIYSENEASEILIKAAKLQEESPEDPDYIPGLTFEELQRMAKELGVDEKFLRRALESESRKETITEDKSQGFFRSISKEFEAVVDGELPPEHFDVVIEELYYRPTNTSNVGSGAPTQVGRTLKGNIRKGLTWATFEMTSRHGRTRLKAKTIPFWPYFMTVYPAFIISIITLAAISERATVSGAIALPILGLVMMGAALLGTVIAKNSQSQAKEAFEKIVDKVEQETAILRENLQKSEASPNKTSEDNPEISNIRNRLSDL